MRMIFNFKLYWLKAFSWVNKNCLINWVWDAIGHNMWMNWFFWESVSVWGNQLQYWTCGKKKTTMLNIAKFMYSTKATNNGADSSDLLFPAKINHPSISHFLFQFSFPTFYTANTHTHKCTYANAATIHQSLLSFKTLWQISVQWSEWKRTKHGWRSKCDRRYGLCSMSKNGFVWDID